MSDFLRCLVGLFAAVAPLGALAVALAERARGSEARLPDPLRLAVLSPAAALVALTGAALLSDPLLDVLNVSGENFQFAAGAAMVPLAMRLILMGDSMAAPEGRLPRYDWLVPYGVPLLAGPVSLIAAVSYAARFGEAEAIGASAVVLALVGALFAAVPRLDRVPLVVVQTLGRLSGGVMLVIAVELVVDGVHSV